MSFYSKRLVLGFSICALYSSTCAQTVNWHYSDNNTPATARGQTTEQPIPGLGLKTFNGTFALQYNDLSIKGSGGQQSSVIRMYARDQWYNFATAIPNYYSRNNQFRLWVGSVRGVGNDRPKYTVVTTPQLGSLYLRSLTVNIPAGPSIPIQQTQAYIEEHKKNWRMDRDWAMPLGNFSGVHYPASDLYKTSDGWRVVCGNYFTGRIYRSPGGPEFDFKEALSACIFDSPNGIRYTYEGADNPLVRQSFDLLLQRRAGNYEGMLSTILEFTETNPRNNPSMLLSRVDWPNGAYETYQYTPPAEKMRLESITNSGGGKVRFRYDGNNVYVSAGEEGEYRYEFDPVNASTPKYTLKKLIYPNGQHVDYKYSDAVNGRDPACERTPATSRLSAEEHSSGAGTLYSYRFIGHLDVSVMGDFSVRSWVNCWPAVAEIKKRSQASEAWSTWGISYAPQASYPIAFKIRGVYGPNQTSINLPQGGKIIYSHTPLQPEPNTLAGILKNVELYDKSNALIERSNYEWMQFTAVTDPAASITKCDFWNTPCARLWVWSEYWKNVPSKITISRHETGSTTALTWITENLEFNSMGFPALTRIQGPGGKSAKIIRNHINIEKRNMFGLVEREQLQIDAP